MSAKVVAPGREQPQRLLIAMFALEIAAEKRAYSELEHMLSGEAGTRFKGILNETLTKLFDLIELRKRILQVLEAGYRLVTLPQGFWSMSEHITDPRPYPRVGRISTYWLLGVAAFFFVPLALWEWVTTGTLPVYESGIVALFDLLLGVVAYIVANIFMSLGNTKAIEAAGIRDGTSFLKEVLPSSAQEAYEKAVQSKLFDTILIYVPRSFYLNKIIGKSTIFGVVGSDTFEIAQIEKGDL